LVVGGEAVYRHATDGTLSLCTVVAVHGDAAGGGVAVRLAATGRERDTLPDRLDASPAAVARAKAASRARAVTCLCCFDDDVDPAACVTCPHGGADNGATGAAAALHWVCVGCLNRLVTAFADQAAEGGLAAFGKAEGQVRCPAPGCRGHKGDAGGGGGGGGGGGSGGAAYSDQLLAAKLEPGAWRALSGARAKLVEQRCQQEAAAAARAEAARVAGLSAAERAFDAARAHAENAILCLACPACGQVFEDFAGCAALQCSRAGCGRAFCGFCLADCGGDAHAHVRACSLNDGGWGDMAAVERVQRRVAAEKLGRFVATLQPPPLRTRLLDHLTPLLASRGIDVAAIRRAAR
jgi:hypothetical protein